MLQDLQVVGLARLWFLSTFVNWWNLLGGRRWVAVQFTEFDITMFLVFGRSPASSQVVGIGGTAKSAGRLSGDIECYRCFGRGPTISKSNTDVQARTKCPRWDRNSGEWRLPHLVLETSMFHTILHHQEPLVFKYLSYTGRIQYS